MAIVVVTAVVGRVLGVGVTFHLRIRQTTIIDIITMTGRGERWSERYQRFLAKVDTTPYLLFSLMGTIASLAAVGVAFRIYNWWSWFLVGLAIIGQMLWVHLFFMVLPEWAPRIINDSGGKARWANSDEIEELYGPSDYTAP
jgi:hypothetical protein